MTFLGKSRLVVFGRKLARDDPNMNSLSFYKRSMNVTFQKFLFSGLCGKKSQKWA